MSNSTHVPVRRVRTVAANTGSAPATGAPAADSQREQEYEAYEGYGSYEGYEGYEEAEHYAQPQQSGLFGNPARALALGGSIVALLLVFAVAIFIANGRSTDVGTTRDLTSGGANVPIISSVSQSGAPVQGSVPPNFEWTDPSGNKVSLASLKGKPVWINFWATWCAPCRMEMPAMQQVYSKHKDDLVILGVSMGPVDSPGEVSEFLQDKAYSWTFIHDNNQELALKYRAGNIPMSYFIGPDGTVKAVSVGAIPAEMMEDFIAQAKQ